VAIAIAIVINHRLTAEMKIKRQAYERSNTFSPGCIIHRGKWENFDFGA